MSNEFADELFAELQAELARLRSENAVLRKDAVRLDWLDREGFRIVGYDVLPGLPARQGIDSAMGSARSPEEKP